MKRTKIKIVAIFIMLVSCMFSAEARRRPLIGVVPGCQGEEYSILRRTYTDAILRAGGIPVILPQVDTREQADLMLDKVDGVMFTGGVDLNPSYYGETVLNETVEIDSRRDEIEMLYAASSLARRIPILAICRGEQMLNVALGGTLYQDLPSQKPSSVAHRQSENGEIPTQVIAVEKGSLLNRIMGTESLKVNSLHHQAVKDPSPRVKVTAYAEDGIIEAYEGTDKGRWLLAVQFHPEMMVRADDCWLKIFEAFVKAAR